MTDPGSPLRTRAGSFGQHRPAGPVDRFGVWLSGRAVHRRVDVEGRRLVDVGCGFEATLVRSVLGRVRHATLLDLAVAPDLGSDPKVTALAGPVEDSLPTLADDAFDVTLCLSVLEHLWEPQPTLDHLHRITAPGGTVLINVPSWRGKRALELSAFRLGLSPAEEMDDHKHYFDPRDLWPLLVRAGFKPSNITCTTHKFTLNTFAACRVAAPGGRTP